jgi:hypothetical protein
VQGVTSEPAKIVRGILVVTSILRPLVGASSSSTSASAPDPDLSDDYPEIGASACGEGGRLIYMVAPNGAGRTTPPADIPPSGDQRRPTPEHRVAAWFRI